MYIEVILPVPIQKLFTYLVPDEMEQLVNVGSRVLVQFGKKKYYSAIVYRTNVVEPLVYAAKSIDEILDSSPVVTERQLALWQWIAEYYICSLGEVYKAAMPSGLKLESETRIIYNSLFEASSHLTQRQEQILNFVEQQKICSISDLTSHLEGVNPIPHIKKLLEMEAIYISEELRDAYKPRTEIVISLSKECRESEELFSKMMDQLTKAPKQMEALMSFIQIAGGITMIQNGKAISRAELLKTPTISAQALTELCKKGILCTEKREISRLNQDYCDRIPLHELSDAQQSCLNKIHSLFESFQTILLHGVTSSGKTEIYIHLIDECIKQGKQVLYMLPEIALTTQITNRLKRHFGDMMGVYHSKFSDSQRVEIWNNLLSEKQYPLILGVRSSILLPFSNLGLIIVDEEHETSYKQFDPAPRYNARDMAIILAGLHKANVVLGSATPSYESYNNAVNVKRFGYVELSKRFAGIEMPKVTAVDMKYARKHKETDGIFSFTLRDRIIKALSNKEQVILFQNRRGFAPYVECSSCAWTAKCTNCDVSMTYHKQSAELVCHYCGTRSKLPLTCPACGMPALQLQGYGTEKIEEEVLQIFPQARVVRMDLDTARTRKAFEEIIKDFEEYKYDILIGTQMISKGLDFERVSTVGIMNVDAMLNIPDFRAYERAFAMISQVAGRAGRHGKRGEVYLQTSSPESATIKNAVCGDYITNTQQQMTEREMYRYPPFTRLINITIKHKERQNAMNAAVHLANALRLVFGSRIIGPQEPPIARIATYYLQRIILKMEKGADPRKLKQILMEHINNMLGEQIFKGVNVIIDVDPV
ncbi:MAG: primosomal protein N' [Marinilabiliaceae bacterium]|nr:primosomal protein N' [Marinilabiliaceae bacterium]